MTRGRALLFFKVIGQRSRSQMGNCQNPCIQLRRDSFDWNLTKLHLLIADDKRKNPTDFERHRPKVNATDKKWLKSLHTDYSVKSIIMLCEGVPRIALPRFINQSVLMDTMAELHCRSSVFSLFCFCLADTKWPKSVYTA